MAEKLIRKNFSNYSAWHYRSKLLPEMYSRMTEDDKSVYLIPFEKIQEDLALLKHAFFTDPKDQSPWNYHEWLISLLTPVQVVSLSIEESDSENVRLVIGFSQKVRDLDQTLEMRLLNELGENIGS